MIIVYCFCIKCFLIKVVFKYSLIISTGNVSHSGIIMMYEVMCAMRICQSTKQSVHSLEEKYGWADVGCSNCEENATLTYLE